MSSSISRLGDASADADDTLAAAPPSVLPVERTIDLLANADVTDNPDHGDVSSEPPESARGVAIEHTLAAPVTKLSGGNHLETLLEAVLPCTVAQVPALSYTVVAFTVACDTIVGGLYHSYVDHLARLRRWVNSVRD